MLDCKLIPYQIFVEFQIDNNGEFELEFNSKRADIQEWLIHEKAHGEAENSDPLVLKLLVELHKKIDELSDIINSKNEPIVKLANNQVTSEISFDGFKFSHHCLNKNEIYFARLKVPDSFKKNILVYFKAIDEMTAKIERISLNDERQWSSFVAQSQMMQIRKQKQQ